VAPEGPSIPAAKAGGGRAGRPPAAAGASLGVPPAKGEKAPAGSAEAGLPRDGASGDGGPAGKRHPAEGDEKVDARAASAVAGRHEGAAAPSASSEDGTAPSGAPGAPPPAGGVPAGHVGPATGTAAADPHPAASAAQPPVATQIAVAVAGAAQQRTTRLTVALAPHDLGGVEITLEFGRDRHLKAAIRVDKADTLQLIRGDATSVVRSLESAGFDLGGAGIQLELRDGGGDRRQPATPGGDIAATPSPAGSIGATLQASATADRLGALDMTV
jgi:hypothetical protein